MVLTVALAALVVAGGFAALWVFRSDVDRAVAEWETIPPAPPAPWLSAWAPPAIEPVPPPAE
jgi:hypothetical protein